MDTTTALDSVRAFGADAYACFRYRADALFELMDALLATGPTLSPAHLSLAPAPRRAIRPSKRPPDAFSTAYYPSPRRLTLRARNTLWLKRKLKRRPTVTIVARVPSRVCSLTAGRTVLQWPCR